MAEWKFPTLEEFTGELARRLWEKNFPAVVMPKAILTQDTPIVGPAESEGEAVMYAFDERLLAEYRDLARTMIMYSLHCEEVTGDAELPRPLASARFTLHLVGKIQTDASRFVTPEGFGTLSLTQRVSKFLGIAAQAIVGMGGVIDDLMAVATDQVQDEKSAVWREGYEEAIRRVLGMLRYSREGYLKDQARVRSAMARTPPGGMGNREITTQGHEKIGAALGNVQAADHLIEQTLALEKLGPGQTYPACLPVAMREENEKLRGLLREMVELSGVSRYPLGGTNTDIDRWRIALRKSREALGIPNKEAQSNG